MGRAVICSCLHPAVEDLSVAVASFQGSCSSVCQRGSPGMCCAAVGLRAQGTSGDDGRQEAQACKQSFVHPSRKTQR